MSKVKIFEDGTSIKWIDKETLKYIENEYSVDIWVDFEPDFFNNGRIIKSSSLVHWQTKPDGASDVINEIKKAEILQKIREYYNSDRIRCRVE
ncbi:MAG: hypothetical protein MPW14_17945 [Candidatus Manganitrophus sp.]|nr:hypothetical protein [Candidatus Manganitrophus sp.]MDC4225156.1 hypothetical protein [Candidatus Manganitrophus sp.]WDT69396.1 MAG: hypothetical protein MPW17_11390 [Candidatus Manganitrophus sp.]WDT79018.1 MAG: hypothetical protein MPW14_17945 [Candidatus Manganitrophus sp.]